MPTDPPVVMVGAAQALVGGFFEVLPLRGAGADGLLLVYNEEAAFMRPPLAQNVLSPVTREVLRGTVFVAKREGESDIGSLSRADVARAIGLLKEFSIIPDGSP